MKYAKVELAPPTPADIPQIRSGIQKLLTGFRTGKWKEATVKVCIRFPFKIISTYSY
jgi:F-type H+-transporting ATPase subunit g